MPSGPRVVEPPRSGLWRVGRSPDPLHFGDPLDPDLLDSPTAGNRFDSPTQDYRVCYFATSVEACFGETLARFRPSPALAVVAQEDGFMGVGEVPADWRHRRLAVRVMPSPSERLAAIRFLDVEAAPTRAVLRSELGDLLAYHGYADKLAILTTRGGRRRSRRGSPRARASSISSPRLSRFSASPGSV